MATPQGDRLSHGQSPGWRRGRWLVATAVLVAIVVVVVLLVVYSGGGGGHGGGGY